MKTFIKFIALFLVVILSLRSSCIKKYPGEPLSLRNNSDQRIYYFCPNWKYREDWTKYCYPDTILPQEKNHLHSIGPRNATGVGEGNPNWEKIFSELPAGKYSVYFFTECPETQEEWDLVRESYDLCRKDVTYQELVENNYDICYP